MKKLLLFFPVILALLIPFPTIAASKPKPDITIGVNLNSHVKYIPDSGSSDFIDADGFSIFINRSIPIGSLEAGFELESYDQDLFAGFMFFQYEMKIRIFYIGYNVPIKLPLGIKIIPGLRCGIYSPKVEASGFFMGQGVSDSDSEAYTFIGVATRLQVDIVKGFGVFVDGSVKQVDYEDNILKIQGGLKYTFTLK